MAENIKITINDFEAVQADISQEFDNLSSDFDSLNQYWEGLATVWIGDSKSTYESALENLLFCCYEVAKELEDIENKVLFAKNELTEEDSFDDSQIADLFQ